MKVTNATAPTPARARRGRAFVAPRFSGSVLRFARRVAGLYLRLAMGIDRVQLHEAQRLYDSIARFQAGEQRLLIVFRHVATWDGPLIVWAVAVGLRRWCRAHRRRLRSMPHTHFLYGKDVLNWAGPLARWAFPRLGGVPVVNGKADRASLSTIRRLAVSGRFPLALAPEAQVTYHMFRVADLAPGASSIAAWAADGSRASQTASDAPSRPISVTLLPVAIGYDYGRDESTTLAGVIGRITVALDAPDRPTDRKPLPEPRDALLSLTATLLDLLEVEYASASAGGLPPTVTPDAQLALQRRIDRVCAAILSRGEAIFAYSSDDPTLARVFRLRYRIMESVYREDVDPDRLSPAERALADHRAELAAAAQRHQQIVDVLEYVRPDYIEAGCSTKRLVEYALNLLDVTNRMRGGNIDSRYSPSGKHAHLLFGDPIDAVPRVAGAAVGSARGATAAITDRTRAAFDALVLDLEARLGSPRA